MWLDPRAGGENEPSVQPGLFEVAATKMSGRKKRPSAADIAFEKLYSDEAQSLRRYVDRLVRNGSDAEDIVQEAFVRLWRVLDDDAIKSPRAVLFTTARNLG